MSSPFSLRIFVADGDPDGLRIVERSNWIGKAVVFPRALLPKIKQREEFGQTGVYLLIGPREDGEGEMLYVGEGDPVRPRLESHYAQKDFWTRAVFFVAGPGQLNKAHVQYLEAQLIQRAKASKRMPLDNSNQPSEPSLSEADAADMRVFLDSGWEYCYGPDIAPDGVKRGWSSNYFQNGNSSCRMAGQVWRMRG